MRLVNNIRKGIKINPDKISSLFFLILSLIVLAVWYRHGKFIGGGEEGLIFWDIERYLEKYRWLWIERGLGAPWVLGYPKLPILYLINLIPSFNITWIHQSIFFLITLFLGTTGIYSLTQAITRTKNKTEAFFAGFFYLFNPYTVAMIYGRFIYFGMLAWGFLPYFLLIILKFLRRENKFSLIRIA